MKKTKERKIEKELLWIVGFFAFLVVLFLISSAIFKSFNRVEYEGLTFTKERFGELLVYRYSYFFTTDNGQVIKYNLYLRNNPVENQVPIEGLPISFEDRAYISLKTSFLSQCPDSSVAIGSLSKFLADNQISVSAGNLDFTEAAVNNQEYVTCENKNVDVVQIKRGDETKILSEDDCYTITVGPDCRILDAVEKFQVHTVIDARENSAIA